ncbi:protein of unknown function [Pseudomonas inefficax]|uniref:Uncharacterized protein n=1 Tax=Pseudomonas inefficax TaxID=2078786 RepID=A0AAQ1PB41_9PSED|nr:protein of unknown function [Pseudomonas inefficax]
MTYNRGKPFLQLLVGERLGGYKKILVQYVGPFRNPCLTLLENIALAPVSEPPAVCLL